MEKLTLDDNHLWDLPASFGNICLVRDFSITTHIVNALPSTMKQLTVLRRLIINFNELVVVPNYCNPMRFLEELSVEDNVLVAWPADLCHLPYLRV